MIWYRGLTAARHIFGAYPDKYRSCRFDLCQGKYKDKLLAVKGVRHTMRYHQPQGNRVKQTRAGRLSDQSAFLFREGSLTRGPKFWSMIVLLASCPSLVNPQAVNFMHFQAQASAENIRGATSDDFENQAQTHQAKAGSIQPRPTDPITTRSSLQYSHSGTRIKQSIRHKCHHNNAIRFSTYTLEPSNTSRKHANPGRLTVFSTTRPGAVVRLGEYASTAHRTDG